MTDSFSPTELSGDVLSWELLDRYLAGECTPGEVAVVERVIAAVPDGAAVVRELRAGLSLRDGRAFEANARLEELRRWVREDGAQNTLRRVGGGRHRGGGKGVLGGLGSRTLRRWTWMAGAASLLALIATFLTVRSQHLPRATHTYTTTVGQRATLSLDDGTRVMMAPQTTLRLVELSQHSRTIVLDGDAYFEVARSAATPFIVQSGTTTTRVLGTAFEVRHYRGDAEVRVAVASGKVLVANGALYPAVPVMAGHVASVTDSIPVVKAVDDINTEIGWLGDQLVFQNAPMSKVLATLTRWYGYQFRCADSTVVLSHITIGLSMRSSTEALASLERLLNVSLTVVGDTVTLTPVRPRGVMPQRTKHYDLWIPTREVGR